MRNIKLTIMPIAILFATFLVSQAVAAPQDVSMDIPVVPMNTERIVTKDEEGTPGGPISSAVDKAIIDAVAKTMPAKSVKVFEEQVASGSVDQYGRPLVASSRNSAMQNDSAIYQNASVKLASTPVAKPSPQVAGVDPYIDKVRKKYKANQKIKLAPGNSELIPVATGLQNRISTPFLNAQVKTSDMEVPLEVDGGFIYITPLSQAPIGLMIGETGMAETMVSITLMPLDVPPVMIDVDVDMSSKLKQEHKRFLAQQEQQDQKRKHLEEAQQEPVAEHDPRVNNKYVDRATTLLSKVAAGSIPEGFDMIEFIPEEDRYPCDIRRMPMYHEVGQRLVSGRELIDVVRVKNDLNGFREIREEYCLSDDVIAVGVFDRATLAPGEDTELYILRDKLYIEKQKHIRARPRLTSTN